MMMCRTTLTGVLLLLMGVGAPARAQVDLTGSWGPLYHEDNLERIQPGPAGGDYLGLPINAAARFRADNWDASLLTLPEHQCKPHPVAYGYRGPANMRIQQEVDSTTQRVVRLTIYIEWMEQYREIWMDGRPHPGPFAPHTWQGFSTGTWEGHTLVVTTTHMKAGWVRRNGLPYSDQATFTERWTRRGDYLMHVGMLEDPVYLTEPLVRTTSWVVAPTQELQAYPCKIVAEIATREPGTVPHFLPGENPMLEEYAERHALPLDAIRGGAETALPEFIRRGRSELLAAGPEDMAVPPPAADNVQVIPVQGNVFLAVDAGGNVAVQVGEDGVLVVDTGVERMADDLLSAIETLANGKTIRWIINTHLHGDHTGGNLAISTSGAALAGGDLAPTFNDGSVGAGVTNIVAHDAVLTRMSRGMNGAPAPPFRAWPTSTIAGDRKDLFFNGEAIRILHVAAAHTDGDLLVFFRKSDVVVAGDVYITTGYPRVALGQGGSIDGEIAALNRILDLTVPRLKQEGGTYVIPGHGRVVDEADVADYRDMVTIIRDRVRDMLERGLTLAQIREARPTRDYDGRFASADGPGTVQAFIETVYESLQSADRSAAP